MKRQFFFLMCLGGSILLAAQEPTKPVDKSWLGQWAPYVEPVRRKMMEWWGQAQDKLGYSLEKGKEIGRQIGEKGAEGTGYSLEQLRELARKAKEYLPEQLGEALGYASKGS